MTNFITAFRRRFGYTPGSLRRQWIVRVAKLFRINSNLFIKIPQLSCRLCCNYLCNNELQKNCNNNRIYFCPSYFSLCLYRISKIFEQDSFKMVLSQLPLIKSKATFVSWLLPVSELIIALLLFIPGTRKWDLLVHLFSWQFSHSILDIWPCSRPICPVLVAEFLSRWRGISIWYLISFLLLLL